MLNDLRCAARMLLHAKGWTAVVVVSLALGIGANTALFSGVNGLLFGDAGRRPERSFAPVGRPNQMVTSTSDYGFTSRGGRAERRTTFLYPMYQQFVEDNQTMTDLFASAPRPGHGRQRPG